MLEIGKLSNELLEKVIISRLDFNRRDVLIRPGIGRDCSIINFGDTLCVISTDPITGAANNLGYLAVHVSCNDIATTGADLVGVMITLLTPPDVDLADIEVIMKDASNAADQLGIDILGGHTEITDSVNRIVLSVTAIGKADEQSLVQPENAEIGDDIILTKKAGLEGTAILAHDRAELLGKHFSPDLLRNAGEYINKISVVAEGKIAGEMRAHAMHDATEGGVLGALWELSYAMKKGIVVDYERIPVADETRVICDFFNIDPLKLISSGCMLIVAADGAKLVKRLCDNGIEANIIGKVVEDCKPWMVKRGEKNIIPAPSTDELYKALNQKLY